MSPLYTDPIPPTADPDAVTPVVRWGDYWVKRDDRFMYGDVSGGKVRTCMQLAEWATTGLVTAGSRSSPQVNIVAHIAREMGLPCRVHVPSGPMGSEVSDAASCGAEVIQHFPGYNSVIVARARADATTSGMTYIPFGMECTDAVVYTSRQVINIPDGVSRIVVSVGSGMSLAGILTGLDAYGRRDVAVHGVIVGADPTTRLNRYAPPDWRDRVVLTRHPNDYGRGAYGVSLPDGSVLDPHYEAKCIPYIQPGDLFWVVGVRRTATLGGVS